MEARRGLLLCRVLGLEVLGRSLRIHPVLARKTFLSEEGSAGRWVLLEVMTDALLLLEVVLQARLLLLVLTT